MTKSNEHGKYHPEVERHTRRAEGNISKSEESKVNKIKTCKDMEIISSRYVLSCAV